MDISPACYIPTVPGTALPIVFSCLWNNQSWQRNNFTIALKVWKLMHAVNFEFCSCCIWAKYTDWACSVLLHRVVISTQTCPTQIFRFTSTLNHPRILLTIGWEKKSGISAKSPPPKNQFSAKKLIICYCRTREVGAVCIEYNNFFRFGGPWFAVLFLRYSLCWVDCVRGIEWLLAFACFPDHIGTRAPLGLTQPELFRFSASPFYQYFCDILLSRGTKVLVWPDAVPYVTYIKFERLLQCILPSPPTNHR